MTLSAAINRHHTAWVHRGDGRPHPLRYAVDGDRLVCFGDDLPAGTRDREPVRVSVHEIAGGVTLDEFSGFVCDVTAEELDPNTVLDLLEHVPLGRSIDEVNRAVARHRTRRLVAIAG
jgi:hypothetical protein